MLRACGGAWERHRSVTGLRGSMEEAQECYVTAGDHERGTGVYGLAGEHERGT